MKILQQVGHQGDTQWYTIDKIPDEAKKINPKFIAESERSGSFHALFGDYDMYEVEDGFIIDAKKECILNHSLKSELDKINNDFSVTIELSKKDHRPSIIKRGLYIVGIQNRFDPMENIKKKSTD